MNLDQTRLVTVSASYGAGGSVIAPALARRLGVPFLQRATTSSGGAAGPEPCTERLSVDEARLTPVHRLLASLTQAMPVGPTQSPPSARHQEENLRRHCEEGVRRLAADGAGVILGRGAAVLLGKERGFHVRLDGPPERRLAQGAAIEGLTHDQARRHMVAADKARIAYVGRLYRADPADPRHYHLVIDSTAIPHDTVVEIILRALSDFPATVPAPRKVSSALGLVRRSCGGTVRHSPSPRLTYGNSRRSNLDRRVPASQGGQAGGRRLLKRPTRYSPTRTAAPTPPRKRISTPTA